LLIHILKPSLMPMSVSRTTSGLRQSPERHVHTETHNKMSLQLHPQTVSNLPPGCTPQFMLLACKAPTDCKRTACPNCLQYNAGSNPAAAQGEPTGTSPHPPTLPAGKQLPAQPAQQKEAESCGRGLHCLGGSLLLLRLLFSVDARLAAFESSPPASYRPLRGFDRERFWRQCQVRKGPTSVPHER